MLTREDAIEEIVLLLTKDENGLPLNPGDARAMAHAVVNRAPHIEMVLRKYLAVQGLKKGTN